MSGLYEASVSGAEPRGGLYGAPGVTLVIPKIHHPRWITSDEKEETRLEVCALSRDFREFRASECHVSHSASSSIHVEGNICSLVVTPRTGQGLFRQALIFHTTRGYYGLCTSAGSDIGHICSTPASLPSSRHPQPLAR
ncbi:hypothetical protein Q5P01_018726 [Channa striata]|uniref:Uncharacterized protein n=1 Tax=Channa striata TaxID=64152 RepID=A0AA88S8Q9_CHASR|nr:hypothetical protein Q5P01_018726 [Channa striata]